MTLLLDRPVRRRPFARADILSRMGETLCVQITEEKRVPEKPAPAPAIADRFDEDPERWDGME